MREVVLTEKMIRELEDIYQKLQNEYVRVAEELEFSCDGCPDNCCDSYFLHHTYAEWAYLWLGVAELAPEKQQELIERARIYVEKSEAAIEQGERPQHLCPLNENGRCILYKHRMLVCRTHGVPATMTRPDGQTLRFPGCFRCQEIVESKPEEEQATHVERTPLLQRLALLESELLQNRRHLVPKVRLTIAEMLVKGVPSVAKRFCEK